MKRRRKRRRFCFDYPPGQKSVSVAAERFSEIEYAGQIVTWPSPPFRIETDRRWNGEKFMVIDRGFGR